MADNAKVLRKQIEKRQVKIDDRTMVRFDAHLDGDPRGRRTYTFGAIWLSATDRWWITGEQVAFGARKFDNDRFLTLVADGLIENVEVATGFESIK